MSPAPTMSLGTQNLTKIKDSLLLNKSISFGYAHLHMSLLTTKFHEIMLSAMVSEEIR